MGRTSANDVAKSTDNDGVFLLHKMHEVGGNENFFSQVGLCEILHFSGRLRKLRQNMFCARKGKI
ncbi:hypothetical protein LguiB_019448 [Lonicera macranthoides]